VWDQLIPAIKPRRILEIGSYEGASACYLIEKVGKLHALEIHCVDSWGGGEEHQARGVDMVAVEARFDGNIELAKGAALHPVEVIKLKDRSDLALSKLLSSGKRNFYDFVYIDGSHQAPDVLCDAVLAFRLLKVGGYLVFDDYLWAAPNKDLVNSPKFAIDSFTNTYSKKIRLVTAPIAQVYVQKMSD
jgi:predicted O-methyltransferase YrrM